MSIKNCAESMHNSMKNTLPPFMLEAHLREVIELGKTEPQKISFVIRGVAEVNPDETIEFGTWSEVSKTEKTTTEKVGQTYDFRQATMGF